ncbi:cytochrome P450 [Xylaria palmicola]|nr:cytochrome P450 [Xylaria palmicola]
MKLPLSVEAIVYLTGYVWVLVQGIFIAWVAANAVSWLHWRLTNVNVPRVGKNPWISGLWRARADFVVNGKKLTREAYARNKHSMYWVQTGDMERLVLPSVHIEELRKLPESHLDSRMAVVERNQGWYNRVDIILKSTAHVDVCRTQLVQNLGQITDDQISTLDAIFRREMKACYQDEDIHSFNAAETFLNIVNRTVARALVGEGLCDDDKWLKLCLDTTVNTGRLCRDLQPWPSQMRPIVCRFLTARRNLDRDFSASQEILSQAIKSRRRGDGNVDILQWLIDRHEGEYDQAGLSFLTNQTLFVAIAATRSTASSIVNTLFDLVAHPEHQEVLRSEIQAALAPHGGWRLGAIQEMKRLDSFIKESQRLHHHLLLSFNRKVRQPLTLSDGTAIPPGTFISTPAYWAARDASAFPPTGDGFEPWRWSDLRAEAERKGLSAVPYLASTPSPHNLHWGYGRNACPGRFMAAVEVKLIIAWILWNFDVSFPLGQTTRPENLFIDERVLPDPTQQIRFQRRARS